MFIGQTEATVCDKCGEKSWDTREYHVCFKGKDLLEAMMARLKEHYLKNNWRWIYKHEGD